jgi:hypothetical protein
MLLHHLLLQCSLGGFHKEILTMVSATVTLRTLSGLNITSLTSDQNCRMSRPCPDKMSDELNSNDVVDPGQTSSNFDLTFL